MERLLFRPAEAADLLGLGRSATYAMIRAGTLPSIRVGRSLRVPAEQLRGWVAAQVEAQEGVRHV